MITSFCARLYGKRQSKRKTEQLIEELKKESDASEKAIDDLNIKA